MTAAPPPYDAVAPQEPPAVPHAQEKRMTGATSLTLGSSLACAAHTCCAAGPNSADAPSSASPPSDEPAASNSSGGLTPRQQAAATAAGGAATLPGRVPGSAAPAPARTEAAAAIMPSFGPGPVTANSHALSEYEMERLRNVERNQRLLESLGLMDVHLTKGKKGAQQNRVQHCRRCGAIKKGHVCRVTDDEYFRTDRVLRERRTIAPPSYLAKEADETSDELSSMRRSSLGKRADKALRVQNEKALRNYCNRKI